MCIGPPGACGRYSISDAPRWSVPNGCPNHRTRMSSSTSSQGSSAVRQAAPACSSTNLPAWSPDGTQIAFVGRRLGHGPLAVRAICVTTADGKSAAPLPHTVCTRRCRLDLIDSPTQLFWVQPNLLLYGDDFRIFT